jgi:catechol 2,3-dioxygenase-like lactoylglutathione lyase family enzyme
VVSADDRDGPQLALEPEHPAAKSFKEALVHDGIPAVSFTVDDVEAEFQRLRRLGVTFRQPPTNFGPATVAIFDDGSGNLIRIATTDTS